jgi:hypothetical protein
MFLTDLVPIGQTDSYNVGYLSGQRTADANAFLVPPIVKYNARLKWLALARSINLVRAEFLDGFYDGYFDELHGLAHLHTLQPMYITTTTRQSVNTGEDKHERFYCHPD